MEFALDTQYTVYAQDSKHSICYKKLTYLLNIEWFPGNLINLRLYNILKSFQCVTQALSQAI